MTELFQPTMHAWTRQRSDSLLVGVCAALGRALGVPTAAVRALFALGGALFLAVIPVSAAFKLEPLAVFSLGGLCGSSIIVYLLAWLSLPSDVQEHRSVLSAMSVASVRGNPSLEATAQVARQALVSPGGALVRWIVLAAFIGVSVTLTILGALSLTGYGFGTWVLFGVGAGTIAGGGALGLLPLSLVDDARWSGSVSTLPRAVLFGIALSVFLMLAGALIMVEAVYGLQAMVVTAAIALLAVGLLSVVLVPWIRRLWSSMREESEERALVRQQAEITAHLHDSVLQTLTVIQRESTEAQLARQLARQQEVELRRWLYGNVSAQSSGSDADSDLPSSLKDAITAMCAQLEQQHGVEIDVVTVGDAPLTARSIPLVRAAREAASNAVRHGKVGVQVFMDAASTPLEIYVRDRGPGFDLAQLPEGRLGVRESILGRMERAGGSARITPAIGGGMEVTLVLAPSSAPTQPR